MQKLSKRKTYTPTNTSLVRSNCDLQLNKVERLSVVDSKTFDNNLEVNPPQHTGGLKDKVYVKSVEGKVLMPCSRTKARHLLEKGKAKVLGLYPFRIQLLFACENQIQEVTLGIDPGYSNIGYSAITEKEELISGSLVLENKMSHRLTTRAMYRRNRRGRLWHRKPRFLNKGKKSRLPPTVLRRINTHITLIKKLSLLVPISKVNIEAVNFAIAKIENPDIFGKEYQQGNLYGYENVKAFIIAREHNKCQLCGESYDEQGWHLHHIIPRSKGGTDKPNNLALLHKRCHIKLHKEGLYYILKASKQYKAETFMSVAIKKIIEETRKIFNNVELSYGYETKVKRLELGLEKTHNNDAFVIAKGINQNRNQVLSSVQKKHNNRVLQMNRKGYKPSIKKKRSIIQPRDLFWVGGKRYICICMLDKGRYVRYGNMNKKEYFKISEVEKYFSINTWQFRYNLVSG